MLTAISNSEFWFLRLWTASKNIDHPVKRKLDRFLEGVREDLFSADNIKKNIDNKLSEIFDLRIEVFRWLVEEKQDVYHVMSYEMIPYLEHMKSNRRLSTLADKILDTLMLNKLLVGELVGSPSESLSSLDIPKISFDNLSAALRMSFPTVASKNYMDWVKCSLYMEYLSLSGIFIYQENLMVTPDRIFQMSDLLDETNRAFLSLAEELSFVHVGAKTLRQAGKDSKGAAIFKKMLDDKRAIQGHLKAGGKLNDLKDQFNFANPLSFRGQ